MRRKEIEQLAKTATNLVHPSEENYCSYVKVNLRQIPPQYTWVIVFSS